MGALLESSTDAVTPTASPWFLCARIVVFCTALTATGIGRSKSKTAKRRSLLPKSGLVHASFVVGRYRLALLHLSASFHAGHIVSQVGPSNTRRGLLKRQRSVEHQKWLCSGGRVEISRAQ